MHKLGMKMDFLANQFCVRCVDQQELKDLEFPFLDLQKMLSFFNIREDDLVPVETLPSPYKLYDEQFKSGKAEVANLATGLLERFTCPKLVDLGYI